MEKSQSERHICKLLFCKQGRTDRKEKFQGNFVIKKRGKTYVYICKHIRIAYVDGQILDPRNISDAINVKDDCKVFTKVAF